MKEQKSKYILMSVLNCQIIYYKNWIEVVINIVNEFRARGSVVGW
jgi:hypothetical protein